MGPQRDQSRSETGERSPGFCAGLPLTSPDAASITSTVVSHDREPHIEKQSAVDPVASSFCVISDVTTISMAQARDNATRQKIKPTSTPPLYGSKSRPMEVGLSRHTLMTTLNTKMDRAVFILGNG